MRVRIGLLLLAVLLLGGGLQGHGRAEANAIPPVQLVCQAEAEYRVASLSPDGRTELCVKDGALYIRRDGSVRPVTMDESRGVPDTYGNLAAVFSRGATALDQNGTVWSPDGRYVAMTFGQGLLMGGPFVDPIVLDTETAGMLLLSATPKRIREAGWSAVVAAAFSGDSRYLYVLQCGDYRGNQLTRIDMQSLTQELLCRMECASGSSAVGLCEMPDGSLLLTQSDFYYDNRKADRLIRVAPGDNGWEPETFSLDAAAKDSRIVRLLGAREGRWGVTVMNSTALDMATNLAALAVSSMKVEPRSVMAVDCLIRFEQREGLPGIGTAWWIPSLDAEKALNVPVSGIGGELTAEEAAAIPMRPLGSAANVPESVAIENAAMSPDGSRVLLLCRGKGADGLQQYALRMLCLADMSLTPVEGMPEGLLSYGTMYIDWCGDTVFLGSTAETAQAFALE